MTGGDWDYVRDPNTGRIKGVKSKTTAEPIKQHDFPVALRHFEGLTSYNAWVFQYPNASTPQVPVTQPTAPGQPTTPAQPTPQAPAAPAVPTAPGAPPATPPPPIPAVPPAPAGISPQTP